MREPNVWLRIVILTGLLVGCQYVGRQVRGPALVLPADDESLPPEVLVANWKATSEDDVYSLTYLAPAGEHWRPRWDVELPQADGWYELRATYDRERVYVSSGDRLLAYGRAEGELAWETRLTDQVTLACPNCLERIGDRLAVVTADYVLHGVDTATGAVVWQVRLNDPGASYDGFWVVDGRVALVDRGEELNRTALYLYESSGGELAQRLVPTCPDASYSPWLGADFVYLTPGAAGAVQVVMLVDCREPTVLSWDLATGEQTWSVTLPEPISSRPDSVLVGRRSLYLADDGALASVALDDGAARLLTESIDPDHSVSLLAEAGEGLVVWARRTRGTTRYELWGLGPAGERRWIHPAQVDGLVGLDSGSADGAFQTGPKGLLLAQALGEPGEMLVELLDPETGAVIGGSTTRLGYASLSAAVWEGDQGFVTASGQLLVVDLASGQVTAEWP